MLRITEVGSRKTQKDGKSAIRKRHPHPPTAPPESRGNKHQQKTEETRGRLLKSALKIFARDGFEAARLEDIARDAGNTRGAFYAHFDSKESLFFALLEQQAREHQAQIHQLLSPIENDSERWKALCEYYVTKAGDPRWSMLILEFKLFAARHPKIRPELVKAHRAIQRAFRQEIEGLLPGNFRRVSEQEPITRMVLHALLHGLVLEHAYDSAGLKKPQLESVLRRVFHLLLSAEENSAP